MLVIEARDDVMARLLYVVVGSLIPLLMTSFIYPVRQLVSSYPDAQTMTNGLVFP
jgi:hypothetical protein